MRAVPLIAGIGANFGLIANTSVAQEIPVFRIAGLLLGAQENDVTATVAKRGFTPLMPHQNDATIHDDMPLISRRMRFQHRNEHTLHVGLEREGRPNIRSIEYNIGKDIETHARLNHQLRAKFGKPTAVHENEDGIEVIVWEITDTGIMAKDPKSKSMTLVKDSINGHTLIARALCSNRQDMSN